MVTDHPAHSAWSRHRPTACGTYLVTRPTQQPLVVRVVYGRGVNTRHLVACEWLPLDPQRPGEVDWKKALSKAVRVEHAGYSAWLLLPGRDRPTTTSRAKRQLERINQGLPALVEGNNDDERSRTLSMERHVSRSPR